MAELPPQLFDVCIACALPEEAKAFLEVVQQEYQGVFEERISPRYGYTYRCTTLKNNKDEPLHLHISWLPRYGPREMMLHLPHVLEECQPRIVIMTGICAGDKNRIQLGDLVVAESTFAYDNGNYTPDEHSRSTRLPETMVYRLDANILQFLRLFEEWKPLVARLESPSSSPRQPVCHFRPMASSPDILTDNPFDDLQTVVRGTVALDLESAALASVMSRHPLIRWLVVKGVSDFADKSKNDNYQDYAARASALYALSFIRAYVTNERLPRSDEENTIDPLASSSQTILSPHPVISGFTSDDPNGQDQLGFQREVEALCSVLAAKEVHPPLSLGLFGDWGSGKSFFMRMMQKQITTLKEAALRTRGETAYCKNIIQLTFNAWHYIDTDLWASLTSEIFEGLASALVSEGSTEEEKVHVRLLAADIAVKSKDALDKAQCEEIEAIADLHEIEESHQKLKHDEPNLTLSVILKRVLNVTFQQSEVQVITEEINKNLNLDLAEVYPDFNNTLTKVKKELENPDVKETFSTIESELRTRELKLNSIRGRAQAFMIALRNSDGRRRLLILLGVVIVTSLFIWLSVAYAGLLIGILVGILTLALGLLVTLAPFFSIANRAISTFKQIQIASETAQKRKQEDYIKKVVDAQERIRQARERVIQSKTDFAEAEQNVQELRADRRVSDFIKQRQASTDYSRYLGLIARARDDFEKLSILLEKEREAAENGEEISNDQGKRLLPPIDRIILYIDDLDRCPEKRVVEVLQAVHLLLAFPLFVVVVGVDSRWLLHSLKQHSEAFQNQHDVTSNDELTQWQASPLNYMEKIFQIPFTLRPMQLTGFEHLIDMLATQQKHTEAVTKNNRDRDKETDEIEEEPIHQSSKPVLPEITPPPPMDVFSREEIDINPRYLQIEEWERTVMKKLYCFMPSPRAVKRFVNIYRLLKASVDNQKLQAFTGDSTKGQYRSTLLLLSMLIGYSTEATEIFCKLLEEEPTKTWWDFIDSFKGHADTSLLPVDTTTRAKLDLSYQRISHVQILSNGYPRWPVILTNLGRFSSQCNFHDQVKQQEED